MSSLRQVLEESLAADPDDRAAHMAYADHLAEEGDPRGEFIQVQLALEDPGLVGVRRRQLQQREEELFAAHGREWLGELAPYLLDRRPASKYVRRPEEGYSFQFRRGWLDSLVLPAINVKMARQLRSLP